jgi:mannosyltransferase OCH1-like enzyme
VSTPELNVAEKAKRRSRRIWTFTMRKNVVIFLIVTVAVLGFAVHNVWTLITLLFLDGSEDAILRAEVPAPKSGAISERPQLIPKIIHQTYKNESIPEHWKGPQQTCIDLHPDYEYKLWTDKTSRDFVAAEYVALLYET